MPKFIGFWGAPGAGKSTAAAEFYAGLKKYRRSAALITEVAFDQCVAFGKVHQPTLFGQQIARELRYLDSDLEYVISDSPVEIQSYYDRSLLDTVQAYRQLWSHRDLRRVEHKRDDPLAVGRIHGLEQAKLIDVEMGEFFRGEFEL